MNLTTKDHAPLSIRADKNDERADLVVSLLGSVGHPVNIA